MLHAADRMLDAIDRCRAPVCVGLDPVLERLPTSQRPGDGRSPTTAVAAIEQFCGVVLEQVAPHVPCVKLQAACFERYRAEGVAAMYRLVGAAGNAGLQVILDAKRGDIGVSAAHYAAGVFQPADGGPGPDWLTVNGYLGPDGIEPFLVDGCGVFVLVRTSNPGGDALQEPRLADGTRVCEALGRLVGELGRPHRGHRGFSAVGAVVGATRPEVAATLRGVMPDQLFLVPGFGAQGGGIDDVRGCFHTNGTGAIVTASRSVIYAFDEDDPGWADAVGRAAAALADQVGRALGLRR